MDAERAEEGAGLPALALWGFLCLLPRSQFKIFWPARWNLTL